MKVKKNVPLPSLADQSDGVLVAASRSLTGRKLNKALRPQQILDAARDVFASKGFSETRVEDIAKKISISKSLIYAYYPTKLELFKSVALALLKPIEAWYDKVIIEDHISAIELIEKLLNFHYEIIENDHRASEFFRLMIYEGGRLPQIGAILMENVDSIRLDILHKVVDLGIRRGEFSPGARQAVEGIEDILVAPGLMMMLIKPIGGYDEPALFKKWKTAHITMVLSLLTARKGNNTPL
jgi:AcrR family transcriptional regulator